VLVVHQNWFRGLVNDLHVVVIVSQVPEFVCKQLRKTVKRMQQVKLLFQKRNVPVE